MSSYTSARWMRFSWPLVALLLVNVLFWVGYDRWRHPHGLLSIEPGQGAISGQVEGRGKLSWKFNLDMAQAASPGEISPPVAGVWSWTDARTLEFEPAQQWTPANQWVVALDSRLLRSVQGFSPGKCEPLIVRSQPLRVRAIRSVGWTSEQGLLLEAQFNSNVDPRQLLKSLKAAGPDGKMLSLHPLGLAPGQTLRFCTSPLPRAWMGDVKAAVRLSLAAGFCGEDGPLGLASLYEQAVPTACTLRLMDVTARQAEEAGFSLALRFNQSQVDLDCLKRVLSVDPAVAFTLGMRYEEVELRGDFKPATRYRITIASPPADAAAEKYPLAGQMGVFVPDQAARVWFAYPSGYLSTHGNGLVKAQAVNMPSLRLRITRIYDNNVVAWRNQPRYRWGAVEGVARPLVERVIQVPRRHNQVSDVSVDLKKELAGQVESGGVYRLELGAQRRGEEEEYVESSDSVVTLSDIGLTAKTSGGQATVWAVSLRQGVPMERVRVRVYSSKNQLLGESTTDQTGLARVPLRGSGADEPAAVVLADRSDGSQLTWLDISQSRLDLASQHSGGADYHRQGNEAFIFSDRDLYRPGETARLRALVRGPEGRMPGVFPVSWEIRRPDGRLWQSKTLPLGEAGDSQWDLSLPNDLPTGNWEARLSLGVTSAAAPSAGTKPAAVMGAYAFHVEEFVPQRLKATLAIGDGPAGGDVEMRVADWDRPLRLAVRGDWLFGKPAEGCAATLGVRAEPEQFSHPAWVGWTFGDAEALRHPAAAGVLARQASLPSADLDRQGQAVWQWTPRSLFEQASGGYTGPWRVRYSAQVAEPGGRGVQAYQTVHLDQPGGYIGGKMDSALLQPGQIRRVQVAFVGADGKQLLKEDSLEANVWKIEWNNSVVYRQGRYEYQSTRVLHVEVKPWAVKMSQGRGVCEFPAPRAGTYLIKLSGGDGQVTTLPITVASDGWDQSVSLENAQQLAIAVTPLRPASRKLAEQWLKHPTWAAGLAALTPTAGPSEAESAGLVAGQWMRVVINAPFAGQLLFSVETDRVLQTRCWSMAGSQVSFLLQAQRDWTPNAYLAASVVRAVDPAAPWAAHRAYGVTRVKLDEAARGLNVKVIAPAEMRPQQTLDAQVFLSDALGQAAAGVVPVAFAVDEGICQLTQYRTPDPLGYFDRTRGLQVGWSDSYNALMPELARASAIGGDGDAPAARHLSPVVARRFVPVALVGQTRPTDAQGHTTIHFQVPQFAGKLRIIVIAAQGQRMGSGQATVEARSPLVMQSSWPRFLSPGDETQTAVTLFNNSGQASTPTLTIQSQGDGEIQFAPEGKNAYTWTGPALAAGAQTTVWVRCKAGQAVGVARLVLLARLNDQQTEENLELAVRPAAPQITRGGWAMATTQAAANVELDDPWVKGTGQLALLAGPMDDLAMPRGLEYLNRYPYGCCEQTVSVGFPLVFLPDLLRKIDPDQYSVQRIAPKINEAIIRLLSMQTRQGGLGMWPGATEPWPWGSVYAAHFIIEAQKAGYQVPEYFTAALMQYLEQILNRSDDEPQMLEQQAYACYVLALARRPQIAQMNALTELLQTPSGDDTASWLWTPRCQLAAAWRLAGRADRAEALLPKRMPSLNVPRQLGGNVGSALRSKAILLAALLDVDGDNPMADGLARELADAGRDGHWGSTQENAWCVMALGRYMRARQSAQPYTAATLLIDQATVAQGAAALRAAYPTTAPLATATTQAAARQVRMEITGNDAARGYLSWSQTGVPKNPVAADSGMIVRRRWLDEKGQPLAENRALVGQVVIVEWTVQAQRNVENLVIEDLLPAGLEIENARLAALNGKEVREDNDDRPRLSVRSMDVRDDRMVLFGDYHGGGEAVYRYQARAITPGTFSGGCIRAEAMYDPSVSSLSGLGQTLRVERSSVAPTTALWTQAER